MLGTLIKALEVDFRNANNDRYLRSATNLSQNLERILAIRKQYPEFKAIKPPLFPKLTELSKLSKKEGLCLTYWHESEEISEFRSVLGNKTDAIELSLLASRPSRFKTASLSRFMQRNEDKVLLCYLTDVSKADRAHKSKRVFDTEQHRQQVTGLLYQLHLLEKQLQAMIARHGQRIDFTPQLNFAPDNFEAKSFIAGQKSVNTASKAVKSEENHVEKNFARKNFVEKKFVVPISFDNGPLAQTQGRDFGYTTGTASAVDLSYEASKTRSASASMLNQQHPTVDRNGPLDIWYNLAEDPKTPYRFLVWLSENHNPYVSQRARATLRRQKEMADVATAAVCVPAATLVS
jgi:hypothetical protein